MYRAERLNTSNKRLTGRSLDTNQSTKRRFCSRRQLLWTLLVLLVVCITIQTSATQKARGVKLTGLLLLRPSINKRKLFPTLQNLAAGLLPESSLEVKQKLSSAQTEQPANLHHHQEGNGEPSADRLLKRVLVNGTRSKTTCRPKSHIVFLKTHKTASSSILNVLYRYGESRNLTFALPRKKHSQMFYPRFFAARFVEGFRNRSGREFHVMCNHMRFRRSEVEKVMPEETFYFSILRHPVALMESVFTYYNDIPAFSETRSLDHFLDTCREVYNSSERNNHYAHNLLAFDFGFDNNVAAEASDLDERAAEAVAAIERDFHLVLISDYFDESMILLKHALCWSLEDVVSFRLNSRSEQTRYKVSPETAAKIERWNALDWRIYLHFNASFWHQVETLVGQERMRREVSQLKALQAKLANTCLKGGGAVDPSKIKEPDLKPFQYGAAVIQGYNLNPHLDGQTKTKCLRLVTPELQYTRHLYSKQFPDVAAKVKQTTKKGASQHEKSDGERKT